MGRKKAKSKPPKSKDIALPELQFTQRKARKIKITTDLPRPTSTNHTSSLMSTVGGGTIGSNPLAPFVDNNERNRTGNRFCKKHDEGQDDDQDQKRNQREAQNGPTPRTLLDPSLKNEDGMTYLEALTQAESWYEGTTKQLKSRLDLAEEMKTSLTELLHVLREFETRTQSGLDVESVKSCREETDTRHEKGEDQNQNQGNQTLSDNPQINRPGISPLSSSSSHGSDQETHMKVSNDIDIDVETVAMQWISKVRVLRARWNANF